MYINILNEHSCIRVPSAFFIEHLLHLSDRQIRIYLSIVAAKSGLFDDLIGTISSELGITTEDAITTINELSQLGLINVSHSDGDSMLDICFCDTAFLSNSSDSYSSILERAERIKGSPLNSTEISVFLFILDTLLFSGELLLCLLEKCKAAGKFGSEYIKTVAINWHDNGIDTIAAADKVWGIHQNSFRNFSQNNNIDFAELERQLLDN
ncbi:DnaD domain-containing protein [Butyrivibrio hungatei]|uniref:DnaB/C C-terminal domain-containing protein n=1 Tax=Butyrivibrio hungatei TaxID=185008 RepID=A0A1D9P6H6_9FIRM|nr:DnaD domain protein [Butyrivibrio hungatei]AOZ97914.1 hypothetical protein bhn_II115 [Butyrivibrio hungatei]